MKRLLLLIICLPVIAFGQHTPLIVEGAAPDFYLTHTVAAKENLYSLGRMYNISPKEIAPFNKLDISKGLNLNQIVKVPLTAANFVQENNTAADEVLVPVYHTVKDKEGLFRISTTYNKVPVDKLKQWNNIKGESVSSGSKIIVGYLKVKKELSPLSSLAKTVAVPKENTAKIEPVKEISKPVVSNETLPVVKNPEKEKAPETKPKETAKAIDKPAVEEKPVAKEIPASEPAKPVVNRLAKNFNGGYFKPEFEKQSRTGTSKNEFGNAAVFKSTSGWEDGKYYCLHNAAAPGTIVKVTNTANGKIIYAKVLDLIPDISQNEGLLIRLSNSAGAELGVGDGKFECSVSFSK